MPEIITKRGPLVTSITSLWRRAVPDYEILNKATTEVPTLGDMQPLSWAENAKIFELPIDRIKKYNDFDEMDLEVVELSSALDVYADFVTYGATDQEEAYVFDQYAQNDRIQDLVYEFEGRLELKDRLWWIAREVAKYGDAFYETVCTAQQIVKMQKLPVRTMWHNYLPNVQPKQVDTNFPIAQREYEGGPNVVAFAPWEVIHYKIGEQPYGVDAGVFSHLRRTYRIQRMLEDAMLVNRLTRAHQRLIYNVDVTNMGVMEAVAYLRKLKKLNKRRRFVDSSGRLKTEENPLAPQDDIYQPVRRGGVSRIDVIASDSSVSSIADIEHFHNKLFTGTKVPKAYLGFERDVNAKATLVQQSLAFLKVVRRLRAVVAKGLTKMYRLELLLNGIDPMDIDFRLRFPGFGVADEQLRWQIEQYKATIVRNYVETGYPLPTEWVVKNMMFNLAPSEANELLDLMRTDPGPQPRGPMGGAPSTAGENPGPTPGLPTGRPPAGGLRPNPLGPEKLSELAEKVGQDARLQDMMDEIRHMLRYARTRPEVFSSRDLS